MLARSVSAMQDAWTRPVYIGSEATTQRQETMHYMQMCVEQQLHAAQQEEEEEGRARGLTLDVDAKCF